jgi:hypothetical protein
VYAGDVIMDKKLDHLGDEWVPDIIIERAIYVLNRALRADRNAIQELFTNRAKCNKVLTDDQTIQVGIFDNKNMVGVLGLINGIFGIKNGYGPIVMILNDDGIIDSFQKTVVAGEIYKDGK